MKAEILNFFSIICILFGIFLIVCALLNPRKLIISNLKDSDFKNKKKYIYFTRLLILIIGSLFIGISLSFRLNIISQSDFSLLLAFTSLITVLSNSFISKKYLLKK